MPSTIQTSYRTKSVNTYGRRTRNVVPVFDDRETGSDSVTGDSGSGAPLVSVRDSATSSASGPSSASNHSKHTSSSSKHSTSTTAGSRPRPVLPSSSLGVTAPSPNKHRLNRISSSVHKHLSRVDASCPIPPSTPRKGTTSRVFVDLVTPRATPKNEKKRKQVYSRLADDFAAAGTRGGGGRAPLADVSSSVQNTPVRARDDFKGGKDTHKMSMKAMMQGRTGTGVGRVGRLSLEKKGKKGLPPSPVQRKAPQKVEVIDLDSDGDLVEKQVRQRKPALQQRSEARKKRIILTDDESESDAADVPDAHEADEEEDGGLIPASSPLEDASTEQAPAFESPPAPVSIPLPPSEPPSPSPEPAYVPVSAPVPEPRSSTSTNTNRITRPASTTTRPHAQNLPAQILSRAYRGSNGTLKARMKPRSVMSRALGESAPPPARVPIPVRTKRLPLPSRIVYPARDESASHGRNTSVAGPSKPVSSASSLGRQAPISSASSRSISTHAPASSASASSTRAPVSTASSIASGRSRSVQVTSDPPLRSSLRPSSSKLPSSTSTRPPPSAQSSSSSKNPPSSRLAPVPAPSTPSVPSTTSTAQYDTTVSQVLTLAPPRVQERFSRTKDPRLLIPYAPDAGKRKTLSDWLNENYFIPVEMDTPVGTVAVAVPAATGSSKEAVSSKPSSIASVQTSSVASEVAGTAPVSVVSSLSVASSSSTTPPPQAQEEEEPKVEEKEHTQEQATVDAVSDPLVPLLAISAQNTPFDFDTFVETFHTEHLSVEHHPHSNSDSDDSDDEDGRRVVWRKIGEASYSEVFSVGGVVLKVIPLLCRPVFVVDRPAEEKVEKKGRKSAAPIPAMSDPEDVLKEVNATRVMGGVHDGFTRLIGTHIVKGRYPATLLDEWNTYNEVKGSESISPEIFDSSQHYAILVLPHGGSDLEAQDFSHSASLFASQLGTKKSAKITGSSAFGPWHQCASVFWQVCEALAIAEDEVAFEHRDLHWGQILVQNVPPPHTKSKTASTSWLNSTSHGVKATMIDFGLSRMEGGSGSATEGVQFSVLEEAIFQGEGDYQYDVYRMMQQVNGDDWERFTPFTNVLWLHYLSVQLLEAFSLRRPIASKRTPTTTQSITSSAMTERECWACLFELDSVLSQVLDRKLSSSLSGTGARTRVRKPSAKAATTTGSSAVRNAPRNLESAKDVLEWGRRCGWVSAE